MKDTSGLYGARSSKKATLQSSLESRLQVRLHKCGSILFPVIWKEKATPSGRRLCAVKPLRTRSKGNASISLPTLAAREGRDWSRAEILARLDKNDGVAKRICALSSQLRSSQEIVGLNPSFGAWMMTLPIEYHSCIATAMRSLRTSRQSSSSRR